MTLSFKTFSNKTLKQVDSQVILKVTCHWLIPLVAYHLFSEGFQVVK